MRLPELGVRKPVAAMMVFAVVLTLGVVSFLRLPVDLMPEIENPSITVITAWSGAGTEDVESKITRVVENGLGSVNQLDELTSISKEGLSSVSCKFKWGTNLDEASNDVRDKLERAKRSLPDDIDDPMIFKFNTSDMPIIFYGVTAKENTEKLEKLINDLLADPLKRIPGVGAVNSFGGLRRQINVYLNPASLAGFGIAPADVERLIAGENLTLPAGNLKIGRVDYTIRIPGEYTDPEQIGDIIVKAVGSRFVRLRDVATVQDGFEDPSRLVEVHGRSAMMLAVQKRSGENTVAVCRAVRKEMEILARQLPEDCELVLITDSSEFIANATSNVMGTVLWGGLFVILTTFFFLRSLRASLIITLTIPFSMIIAFVFMHFMGWTLNLMSMASLSIAIGMVVDNAIVILENTTSQMERGARRREAAMFGAEEVGLAVMASTLTTVVVFLPMVFLSGITGIMFKQLAGLIAATLTASLFCALYLTPMLCSKLLVVRKTNEGHVGGGTGGPPLSLAARLYAHSERAFLRVETGYAQLLGAALRHRAVVVLTAIGILAVSVWGARGIGSEFMPEEDTGELRVNLQLPVGTRVERTADVCRRAVDAALRIAGPENVVVSSFRCGASRSGMGAAFGGTDGSHTGSLMLKFVPTAARTQSSKAIGQEIAAEIRTWPEIDRVFARTDSFLNRVLRGGGAPLSVEVFGHDLEATDAVAQRIRQIALEVPGARDVIVNRDIGQPELIVTVDRQKALAHGLGVTAVAETMRTYFQGTTASMFRQADDEYDILVRFGDASRQTVEDLRGAELTTPAGRRIRLDSVAEIVEARGPVLVQRKNQERVVTVELDTLGRSQGEVVDDLRARVEQEVLLPYGVTVRFGGMAEEQADSFHMLALLLALGIALVYMVMAGQFESFRLPFLIMFSIPFAFTGVVAALRLTGTPLTAMSYIGGILLVGVVVNNAILLVDQTGLLRQRGLLLSDAVREAGRSRLRPVLMTTATTLLGMLPMAVGGGDGAEMWRPLAVTVIGGLSVSSLVTLFIVPVMYHLAEARGARKAEGGAVA